MTSSLCHHWQESHWVALEWPFSLASHLMCHSQPLHHCHQNPSYSVVPCVLLCKLYFHAEEVGCRWLFSFGLSLCRGKSRCTLLAGGDWDGECGNWVVLGLGIVLGAWGRIHKSLGQLQRLLSWCIVEIHCKWHSPMHPYGLHIECLLSVYKVHVDSMTHKCTPSGVLMKKLWSPQGVFQEFTKTLYI